MGLAKVFCSCYCSHFLLKAIAWECEQCGAGLLHQGSKRDWVVPVRGDSENLSYFEEVGQPVP